MVNPTFAGQDKVLLIDGHNLLMRILFSKIKDASLISAPDEIVASCSLIFMTQLSLCVRKHACTRLYAAFDCGGSLRKKALLEQYKGQRSVKSGASAAFAGGDESLFGKLLEKCIALCHMFNIPVFHEYGIEADDMIGIAAEHLSSLGKTVVILSNDSDFLQLLKHDNVICSIPYKKVDITKVEFTKYFSECSKSKGVCISPWEYVFYKCIVGDDSDNIDGIRGLGYKTLHKLMEKQLAEQDKDTTYLYLSDGIEYIKQIADPNGNKLQKLLHENIDILVRNYKLIELSSKYVSPNASNLTLKKLLEAPDMPNKMQVAQEFYKLFPTVSNQLEFISNQLVYLRSIYTAAK